MPSALHDMQCIMPHASCPLSVLSQCAQNKLGVNRLSVASHNVWDSIFKRQHRDASIVHVATYSLLVAGHPVAATCSPVTTQGHC